MKEIFIKIDKLKKEWDSLQPLKKEWEENLWQKFRLEWNYNSNHIEGNTLTYGETKLLLKLGDEFRAQNNSLKDVNEMRAHDVAIFTIRNWAKEKDRTITENDIRTLNEIILIKPFWTDAITKTGQSTRRLITPGKYKEFANHVILKSGELFKYAELDEVIQKMQELIDWYRNSNNEHPIVKAATFHYKFVCIHPFDDGNGRVSRLIMNYHLMKNGFPSVIIKSADKQNYLYALNQADAGDSNSFVKYIAQQAIWSLEIAIKAAKGERIVEKDDLYKEIEVWKNEIKSGIPTTPKRNDKLSVELYENSILNLFKIIEQKVVLLFKDLFLRSDFELYIKKRGEEHKLKTKSNLSLFKVGNSDQVESIKLYIEFKTPLKKSSNKKIIVSSYIIVHLDIFEYLIRIDSSPKKYKKNYSQSLSEDEVTEIVEEFVSRLFGKIKRIVG